MILKIMRYLDQDWWMLDNIRKISKAEFEQTHDDNIGKAEADISLLDYENWLNQTNNHEVEGWRVVSLICRLNDGTEFRVLFDTVAYLLNDDGKTIEVILANYKD
uniref:Uncharacterized protein n=1 Tax=viral metagenome TaxID=1070528 RepID=A0A6M3KUC8_9ZZZZ